MISKSSSLSLHTKGKSKYCLPNYRQFIESLFNDKVTKNLKEPSILGKLLV